MTEQCIELQTPHGAIRGMLHLPSESSGMKHAVVIIHGYFSANRVGPARLYVQLSRRIAAAGYPVLRCDALGVGDSDGQFSNVTLQSELRDFRTVCDHARSLEGVEAVALVGHSMGANLALRLARRDLGVECAILMAPEVRFRGGMDRLLSGAQLAELLSRGWTYRKGLHINATFVQELRDNEPLALAEGLKVPFVVIQGSEDELYEPDGAVKLAAMNPTGRVVLIPGADHNFLGASREKVPQIVVEALNSLIGGRQELQQCSS